jgi:hypothetical protein
VTPKRQIVLGAMNVKKRERGSSSRRVTASALLVSNAIFEKMAFARLDDNRGTQKYVVDIWQ